MRSRWWVEPCRCLLLVAVTSPTYKQQHVSSLSIGPRELRVHQTWRCITTTAGYEMSLTRPTRLGWF